MRLLILILSLLCGNLLCGAWAQGRPATQSREKITPSEWQPSLFQARSQLEAELKETVAQQEMNIVSRQIADIADAELFFVYVRLFERLDASGRAALLREQREWLKARTKHAQDSIVSEGGSAAPLEANTAEIEFTDKRTKELERRLTKLVSKRK